VLRDFEREILLGVRDARVGELQGIVNLRQLAFGKLDVNDRPDDLDDLAEACSGAVRGGGKRRLGHGARVYHEVNGSSMIDAGIGERTVRRPALDPRRGSAPQARAIRHRSGWPR
jgi:hypothetical protein